jgi:hypothetical protein
MNVVALSPLGERASGFLVLSRLPKLFFQRIMKSSSFEGANVREELSRRRSGGTSKSFHLN